jgi:hypothetical protein
MQQSLILDSFEIELKLNDDEFTKYKEEFQKRLENSYETVDKKKKRFHDENADDRRQKKEEDALDRNDKEKKECS